MDVAICSRRSDGSHWLLPLWADAEMDGTLPPHVVAGAPAPSLQLRPLVRERKGLLSMDNVGGAKGGKVVSRAIKLLSSLPKSSRPAESVTGSMGGSVVRHVGGGEAMVDADARVEEAGCCARARDALSVAVVRALDGCCGEPLALSALDVCGVFVRGRVRT